VDFRDEGEAEEESQPDEVRGSVDDEEREIQAG